MVFPWFLPVSFEGAIFRSGFSDSALVGLIQYDIICV